MSDDAWNVGRYLEFQAERKLPFDDLVALVERRPGMRVLDLGCGTGHLTAELAGLLDVESIEGVDASPAMLEATRKVSDQRVTFCHAEADQYEIKDVDLVFSNAALHWMPDHPSLFRRIRAGLRQGGQVAVQMPNNFGYPTHTIASALAARRPYTDVLGGLRQGAAVMTAEEYAALLRELGFARQVVREAIYLHELESSNDVLRWVRGSMLTWYEKKLGNDLFPRFLQAYTERLFRELGDRRPFPFTYRRILLWAAL